MELHRRTQDVTVIFRTMLTADYAAKRRIVEITCLNCTLDGATLVPTMRKPFDVLAEGLVSKNSRGDKTAIELFRSGVTTISIQLPIAAQGLASLLPRLVSDVHSAKWPGLISFVLEADSTGTHPMEVTPCDCRDVAHFSNNIQSLPSLTAPGGSNSRTEAPGPVGMSFENGLWSVVSRS